MIVCARSAIKKIGCAHQLTDLSGIRIVVYFETDVGRVSKVIREAFDVDERHSINQEELLSPNQTGYRSFHFVCELGNSRSGLPEFVGLGGLKFEFQVRTVLQHAWAELAHDRNYKFSGKLPRELERRLFLYAGMLEIADRGFDELSREIDLYVIKLRDQTSHGDLAVEVTSLSLKTFVDLWAEKNSIRIEGPTVKSDLSDLVRELNQFGVHTLAELQAIIPPTYVDIVHKTNYETTIHGYVRDWMLIHDWRRFRRDVSINWLISRDSELFSEVFYENEFEEFASAFKWEDDDDENEDQDGDE